MNSVRYLEVLKDTLLDWMYLYGCSYFLQYGAPCRASKVTKAFLDQQDFKIMGPGNSPDLNPIENC
jgi:hypothetical protein